MRSPRIVLIPVAIALLIVSAFLLYLRQSAPTDRHDPTQQQEAPFSSAGSRDQQLSSPRPEASPQAPESSSEAGFIDEGRGRRERQSRRRLPTLTVLAVAAATDEPLAEAVVRFQRKPSENERNEFEEESTAADGTVRFELQESGYYYISFRCEGYLSGAEPVRVDMQEGDLFRKVVLTQAYTVQGRVRSRKGAPIGQAEVRFSSQDEPTVVVGSDAEGEFSIVLAAGRYRVSASKESYLAADVYPFEVGRGRPQEIEIVLEEPVEGVVLSGNVMDLQGHPIPRARISATDLAPRPAERAGQSVPTTLLGVTSTELDGSFRLEAFPAASVLVEVEAHAFEPLQQTIRLEQNLQRDFRLKPYPTFTVHVVGASGEELPIDSGSGASGLEVIGVNAAGQSVVALVHRPGLPSPSPGKPLYFASEYPFEIYAVDRVGDHGISERIQVGAPRSEVTLVADQPAELRGYVSDRMGNPVSQFVVSYSSGLVQASRFFESEDGAFILHRLPEGPCTIQVLSQEFEDFSTELVLSRQTPSLVEAVVSRRSKPGM